MVVVDEVIPAPFVTSFEPDVPLFERDEGGLLGGVVMVLEGAINPVTLEDKLAKDEDVVSEAGAGPVTKGVGNGPVPLLKVGCTV